MADKIQESKQEVYVKQSQQDASQLSKEAQEVQNSSYTKTDVKVTAPNLVPPFISTSVNAKDLVGEGFQASVARITGASDELDVEDTPEMIAEARNDSVAKAKEQELLNAYFEKELEKKSEAYRKQQEIETEKIRKELEQQHLKDVEFRKELMEAAIENQKKQIDLEARYAKKELERERVKARLVLDKSKFHSDIQVNMNAAAGNTQSGSQQTVVSESEKIQAV